MGPEPFGETGRILELALAMSRPPDPDYIQQVRRARGMSGEDKLAAGFELFEFACSITRAGIRHQHPQADAAEVERLLKERLKLAAHLEIGRWKSKR